jgi:hypothetical protein
MEAFARIGVLVERRAVEAGQAMRIRREVRRHPIQNHAHAGAMTGVDEAGEALGWAEPRAGRKLR